MVVWLWNRHRLMPSDVVARSCLVLPVSLVLVLALVRAVHEVDEFADPARTELLKNRRLFSALNHISAGAGRGGSQECGWKDEGSAACPAWSA